MSQPLLQEAGSFLSELSVPYIVPGLFLAGYLIRQLGNVAVR